MPVKGATQMYGRRRAFTLIELLVVIAIIAILAAILFPVFARAREQARATTCISNLKQLGLSIQMYLQDYDEVFPVAWTAGWRGPGGDYCGELYGGHAGIGNANQLAMVQQYSYGAQIYPYIKNAQIFICPSDTGAVAVPGLGGGSTGGTYQYGQRWSSYHYRFWMYAGYSFPECGYTSIGPGNVVKESVIPYPAQVYVFHELWVWHDNRRVASLPWQSQGGWDPTAKMNFAFADGHAKNYPVDASVLRAPWWPGQGYDYHWPRGGGWPNLCDVDINSCQ